MNPTEQAQAAQTQAADPMLAQALLDSLAGSLTRRDNESAR